jgi:hypothetical protein
MDKPTFPKPRLIREDFLPNQPMKNYRIKKVTKDRQTLYYTQQKFLWWWVDVNLRGFDYFYDLDNAKQAILNTISDTVVEYIYNFD